MSTGIFDAYDQEFSNLSRDIQSNISDLKSYTSSNDVGKINSLQNQIDALINQANDLVKQMNLEARSQDAATRKILTEKVSTYTKSVSNMKSDFMRAKEQSQRSSLIGEKSGADRQRLLDTNEKLNRQNDLIRQAQRTVAETEEVGIEITNELARNREKIESSQQKVGEFQGITDSARRILSSMNNREVQQKFILCFIGAVLIIVIVLVAYFTTQK